MKTCPKCRGEGEVPNETPDEPKADIEQQQRIRLVMKLRGWANENAYPGHHTYSGVLLAAAMLEANDFKPSFESVEKRR